MTGAIIPALMHRIPSKLHSLACLGESSTRMGDLLGSPRVAPIVLGLFGSYGVPFRLATCRPNGFNHPHHQRRRAIVDPIPRSQDTGLRNRAYEIFPRFLSHGISHRLRTIGGNDKLFERSGRKLWVETLGGGDGSRRGSVRTCFMRR